MSRLFGVRHLRYVYLVWRRAWCWRHCQPWTMADLTDEGPDNVKLAAIWRGEA